MPYTDPPTAKVYASAENAQAARIKATGLDKIEKIRANADLTPSARRRMIAETHHTMRAGLGRLKETRDLKLTDEYRKLEATLFSGLKIGRGLGPADSAAVR